MAGGTYMLGEERLDTVGTEPAPCTLGNSARSASRRFLGPCLENGPRVRGQRCASFLSPFADASHMSAGAKMDVVPCRGRSAPGRANLSGQRGTATYDHVVRAMSSDQGPPRIASISGRVRKCTCRLSCRLLGIARTRWMWAL